MSVVSLTVKDGITPELERLIKKSRNMTRPMRKVELLVMRPLRARAWAKSGLKSDSGELEKSVKTWHGKKSAGVSVHTLPGKDLIIPKAVTHTEGRRRGSATRKRQYAVRGHTRRGRRVSPHMRRNAGAPWGDIKARPFIPVRLRGAEIMQITRIIKDHLDV